MSPILFTLPELYNSYKTWISENPQLASDLESTVKWISYFIAGRVNNSNVLSEMVFSLSNLMVLFNDRIICNARNLKTAASGDTLKIWLTVLEYSEVFVEISARKLWGSRGRWIVIFALQIAKCAARLALLLFHKVDIIQNPPVPPLKRNDLVDAEKPKEGPRYVTSMTFTLKRSGRVIRRISSAPPVHCRSWKPPVAPSERDLKDGEEQEVSLPLGGQRLLAEVLYVVKPLIHLASVACWGFRGWRPWLVSLGVDLTSLQLYKYQEYKNVKLNHLHRLELSRRTVALLLYLLRSPFYEKYSANRIKALLYALSNNLPLARLICIPLVHYIPVWQDTYFYMWST